MRIDLHIVYGRFHFSTVEWSSKYRNCMGHKPKILTIGPLRKSSDPFYLRDH